MIVAGELKKLGLHQVSLDLGMAEVQEDLSRKECDILKAALLKYGLELLDDKKSILVEKIKIAIIELIHYSEELPKIKMSEYLGGKLGHDYTYLANIFSEVKGITIQQFIIIQKVERIKELLLYEEMSMTEIAEKMHYSSVAHLSIQFKKITGLAPTFFHKLREKRRSNLENL
jgi:AraC-like DNA-binding protein